MKLKLSLLIFAGAAAQSIHATPIHRQAYIIRSKADNNQCLVSKGNSADGTKNELNPIFWSCNDSPGDNARWYIEGLPGKPYVIRSKADDGQCLVSRENNDSGTADGLSPIFYSCEGSPGSNAHWDIIMESPSNAYVIHSNAKFTQCLGSKGNSATGTTNGLSPIFWSCADSPGDNARWIIEESP
ncbi:hypothetical protein MVEG_08504 [Podila verticillata NRRL 6337]|nr:hypothetical protein MVEG_08504 [Podila verticillata NRRL 6337]